jgi:hypothetical protein
MQGSVKHCTPKMKISPRDDELATDLLASVDIVLKVLDWGGHWGASAPNASVERNLSCLVPEASWVAAGGRKPLTTIEWSAAKLVPQEIAAVTFIPDQFIDDAGFRIWESVRDEIRGRDRAHAR